MSLGQLKMGRWIRYVPHPVIGGLWSQRVGVLTGGINVIANIPVTQANLPRFEPNVMGHLAAGFGPAAAMLIIPGRAKHHSGCRVCSSVAPSSPT